MVRPEGLEPPAYWFEVFGAALTIRNPRTRVALKEPLGAVSKAYRESDRSLELVYWSERLVTRLREC